MRPRFQRCAQSSCACQRQVTSVGLPAASERLRRADSTTPWGSAGAGPGQFALPHSLWVDRHERVWAVDRENNRIQRFDSEGRYLDEWTDLVTPMDLFITPDDTVYIVEAPSRVSIFDMEGRLLDRWGEDGPAPGEFADSPHSIWVDDEGSLYIGEVATLHDRVQKFRRT